MINDVPEFVIPYLADALVVLGVLILTIGVYGMIWLPDTYLKLHPGSKAVFLGLLPLLLAAAMVGEPAMAYRSVLMATALLLTTPISAHAIAKAAQQRGEVPEASDEEPRRRDRHL